MIPAPEYDEEKQHHLACHSLKKLNQCFSDFKDKPKNSRHKNITSLKKSLRFMCQQQLAEADWESVLEEFPELKQHKKVIKRKIKRCKVDA